MGLTQYAARFGRDIVGRADDFASRVLASRARYIVHACERVLRAHQPALLTRKVPCRSHRTTAGVSTLLLIHDVDHVVARYVDFAVQRTRLVWCVK